MVNSYSSPLGYDPSNMPVTYGNSEIQRNSSAPALTTGAVLGGITGTVIGLRKNPNISKKGEFADSFVKRAYENYVKKAPDAGKNAYEQGLEILKKIDKVKNMEELKTLLNKNSEAAQLVCAELKDGPENFIESITKRNLNSNKKTIKEKLTAGNKIRFQNMKNLIESCWDSDKKKLVKPEGMDKDLFKAIKKASKAGKGKLVAKYAAISAAIGGTIAFIAHKLFSAKNNVPIQ